MKVFPLLSEDFKPNLHFPGIENRQQKTLRPEMLIGIVTTWPLSQTCCHPWVERPWWTAEVWWQGSWIGDTVKKISAVTSAGRRSGCLHFESVQWEMLFIPSSPASLNSSAKKACLCQSLRIIKGIYCYIMLVSLRPSRRNIKEGLHC